VLAVVLVRLERGRAAEVFLGRLLGRSVLAWLSSHVEGVGPCFRFVNQVVLTSRVNEMNGPPAVQERKGNQIQDSDKRTRSGGETTMSRIEDFGHSRPPRRPPPRKGIRSALVKPCAPSLLGTGMVAIRSRASRGGTGKIIGVLIFVVGTILCSLLGYILWAWETETTEHVSNRIPLPTAFVSSKLREDIGNRGESSRLRNAKLSEPSHKNQEQVGMAPGTTCPYTSLSQLTPEERFPRAGTRHMVNPPVGGKLSLVCCQTTKGPWSIVVHEKWAPLGAQRFLAMVQADYFRHKVALMRCLSNFICQFGLAGPASKDFDSRLPDDPNWLPEGPDHRTNAEGVKRFAQGYLAYAGGGNDSRGVQLIVSLKANGRLAGGSPWEVPWGELVGQRSFETLANIYTGYGDKGPPQGRLRREGSSEEVAKDFPMLDYILWCELNDRADDDEDADLSTEDKSTH
jgi:cyclophilin family peptidyl-prolyl cis-trans isomerase